MPQPTGSVAGPHDEHDVAFFGLSTCIWCRKTRGFLEEQGVAFDYTYVDLLSGQEREAAKEQIRPWNPSISFPTVVIDERECVIGYRPDELRQALGLDE